MWTRTNLSSEEYPSGSRCHVTVDLCFSPSSSNLPQGFTAFMSNYAGIRGGVGASENAQMLLRPSLDDFVFMVNNSAGDSGGGWYLTGVGMLLRPGFLTARGLFASGNSAPLGGFISGSFLFKIFLENSVVSNNRVRICSCSPSFFLSGMNVLSWG